MNNICILIDVPYGTGGTFQYNQQLLSALLSLPSDRFKITVYYVDEAWIKLIPESAKKIKLRYPERLKKIYKALFGIGAPRVLMKMLFSCTSLRQITAGNYNLAVFPSQDLAGLFLTRNAVNVVHDLMHRYERRFKESSGFGRGKFRDRLFGSMNKYSKIVLVDSNVGKKQLIESYGVSNAKIEVLPYIAPTHITEYDDKAHEQYFRELKLPAAFIFYPAQFWPHKNHHILLEAAKVLKQKFPDFHLVFTGPKRYAYNDLFQYCLSNGLKDNVTFLEYVSNEVLGGFYVRARALVMPTFYGPTNIPPLEAVALKCPVAVSRIYGMPEQLGDASLYFDNTSLDEVVAVLESLWSNDSLRDQLRKNCAEHFSKWNQQKFNRKVLQIVEQSV